MTGEIAKPEKCLRWMSFVAIASLVLFAVLATARGSEVHTRGLVSFFAAWMALGLLVAVAVLWAMLWARADKWAKVSTPSLLVIWIWLSGVGDILYPAFRGGQPPPRSMPLDASAENLLGVGIFAALALMQYYLRRRWRSEGSTPGVAGQR
jgi:drug/metabolite transporter (DMT)-like permease